MTKKQPVILALSCCKGGVGKSTISVNVAYSLSNLLPDKKVLLIDFDPQGTASNMLRIPVDTPRLNVTGIGGLLEDYILTGSIYDIDDIKKIIYRPTYERKKKIRVGNRFDYEQVEIPYNFDIIPTAMKLSFVEIALTRRQYNHVGNVDTILRKVVEIIKKELDYDYIIIDSMPSLGPLTINVLNASDYIVIPTTMNYHSIVGIGYIEDLTALLSKAYNREIKILGIVKNRVHENGMVDTFIENQLEIDYPDLFKLATKIPDTIKIEKMVLDKKIAAQASETISQTFTELTKEILERIRLNEQEKTQQ